MSEIKQLTKAFFLAMDEADIAEVRAMYDIVCRFGEFISNGCEFVTGEIAEFAERSDMIQGEIAEIDEPLEYIQGTIGIFEEPIDLIEGEIATFHEPIEYIEGDVCDFGVDFYMNEVENLKALLEQFKEQQQFHADPELEVHIQEIPPTDQWQARSIGDGSRSSRSSVHVKGKGEVDVLTLLPNKGLYNAMAIYGGGSMCMNREEHSYFTCTFLHPWTDQVAVACC